MLHEVEWSEKKISDFWDNKNRLIDSNIMSSGYFSQQTGPFLLRKLNRSIGFKNKDILDYGCGQGHLIDEICSKYKPKSVCGVDLSSEACKDSNTRNKKHQMFKGAYQLSEDMPLEPKSFDIVFLLEVVEHMRDEDISQALSIIKSLLKPNGMVVISTPDNEDLRKATFVCPDCGCYFHSVQHVRAWTPASLEKTVKNNGFETYKIIETTLFAPEFLKPVFASFYSIVAKLLKKPQKNLIYVGKKAL